jgi:osmoprotectant transport system substrate-binding protein
MDRKTALGLIGILLLAGAGCGSRHELTVGGKDFTEQDILGEIIAQHVEKRLHVTVARKLHLGGTLLTYQGLQLGQIDIYPEYTGTIITAILHEQPDSDPDAMYDRARTELASNDHIVVMKPLGFNNSFAMVIRSGDAKMYHLATLSDAANYKPGWDLGEGYEFQGRPDGSAALMRTYDLPIDQAPKIMDLGLLYPSLLEGKVNMVAGNETDGLLSRPTFVELKDDKHAFPAYQACILVRESAFREYPGLREALQEMSGKFDNPTMRRLNYEVDGLHERASDVAADWLKKAGL